MVTNVYVDGFNLYYGCLNGTPYKSLDLGALSQALLPPKKIQRIRYFTAKISAQADPKGPVCQSTYLRALQTVPRFGPFLDFDRAHAARRAASRRTSDRRGDQD